MFDFKLFKGFKDKGFLELERSSEDCICIKRKIFDSNTGEEKKPEISNLSISQIKEQIEWFTEELSVYKEVLKELSSLKIKEKE